MSAQHYAYQRALEALHEGDHHMCGVMATIALERDYGFGAAHLLRAVSMPNVEVLLASAYYGAACRYAPHDVEVWFNRGVHAEATGQHALAIDCYRRAHALDPGHVGTLVNGAQILRVHEYFEEAVAMARLLRDLEPDNPAGPANEAISLIFLGDAEASDRAFAEAIRLSPDPSLLLWEQHFSLLARHRFEEAWKGYENRFACGGLIGVDDMAFCLPRWSGKSGQHVIAYGEQGLGDQIMFASMIAELQRDCGQVSLAVSPPLVELFRASFPDTSVHPVANGLDLDECARVVDNAGSEVEVDAVIPLGSLPALYRNRREDFPGGAYLQPSSSARSYWKKKANTAKSARSMRIGLCWASNPAPDRFFSARRAVHKTMPASVLAPLVERFPDASFIAVTNVPLETFDGAETLADRVEDVSSDLVNLDLTAALLETLDLLITVDTGVAHLAGATGLPVWILLHSSGDARWGQSGAETSYWYRSARLFWQAKPGDWGAVVARVGEALDNYSKGLAECTA